MSACRIAILPAAVVEQIAAGEVVERPASAVKELAENALDAGAGHVIVELREGGRRGIRVVDDGCGMSAEEVELALRRHATSKLRAAEDLWSVRTMGFRGEGLASIAAVARLTVESRRPADDAGWRVEVAGGQLSVGRPVGRPPGTTVVVEDLFFNTPGRLKFLKSTAAETAHVNDVVSRLSCGFPAVRFTLSHNGRPLLELPPAASRAERVRRNARRWGERLREAALTEEGLRVEACLGPPEDMLSTARQLVLLVNGRPVQDRGLVLAVVRGYGTVPVGRYPVGALFVDLDPRTVDVNVHPQKREVRFRDAAPVLAAVERCVCRCVGAGTATSAPPPARSYQLAQPTERGAAVVDPVQRAAAAARRFWGAQRAEGERAGEALAGYAQPAPAAARPGGFGALRILGQSSGGFAVCEDGSGLLLVDVAAARSHVALFRLRETLRARGGIPAQRLLVPATIAVDADASRLLEREADLLRQLGLEAEPFGGGSWIIRSVPQPLSAMDPALLLRELLAALRDVPAGAARVDRALLRLAEAAGGAGGPGEGELLRRELLALDEAGLELEREVLRVELARGLRVERDAVRQPLALRLEHDSVRRRLQTAGAAPGDASREDGGVGDGETEPQR